MVSTRFITDTDVMIVASTGYAAMLFDAGDTWAYAVLVDWCEREMIDVVVL